MGSSSNRKPSDAPFGVQESGPQVELEEDQLEGVLEAEQPSSVQVPLVRIDPDVHRESTVGDSVTLELSGDRLLVFTSVGNLGEVPPNLVSRVRQFARIEGRVVELQERPLRAVVEFGG